MDQAVIDTKFIQYYSSLGNYGNTGQGWPFPIYWPFANGTYDNTFDMGIQNTFHIGASNNAKIVSNYGALTDDVNDNTGNLILAPFMILSTRVKGSKKDALYARRNLAVPLQLEKLTLLKLYFFWRFVDQDRPEWFMVEDNRKWPFMRNAGYLSIGYQGQLNQVTSSKDPDRDNQAPDQELEQRQKNTTNIILIALCLLAGVVALGLIFIKK